MTNNLGTINGDYLFKFLSSNFRERCKKLQFDESKQEEYYSVLEMQSKIEIIRDNYLFSRLADDINEWLSDFDKFYITDKSLQQSELFGLVHIINSITDIVKILSGEANQKLILSLMALFSNCWHYNDVLKLLLEADNKKAEVDNIINDDICDIFYNKIISLLTSFNYDINNKNSFLEMFYYQNFAGLNLKRPIKVVNITHTDDDGFFCAGLLYTVIMKYMREYCTFEAYPTGYKIKYDEIKEVVHDADEIWVTDLNLDNKTFTSLVALNPEARWYYVDHHNRNFKTSKEYYEFMMLLKNIFNGFVYVPTLPSNTFNKSACLLLSELLSSNVVGYEDIISNEIIDYVSAWDTRCFAQCNEDMVFNVHYGLSLGDTNPTTEAGLEYMYNILSINDPNIDDYIDNIYKNGKTILAFKDTQNNLFTKIYGFEFYIIDDDGIEYSGFAYNYIGDSYCFPDEYMNKYDICATYCITSVTKDGNPNFKVTLYSSNPKINCGGICNQINSKGGGHYGAGGFMSSEFPFVTSSPSEEKLYILTAKQKEMLAKREALMSDTK